MRHPCFTSDPTRWIQVVVRNTFNPRDDRFEIIGMTGAQLASLQVLFDNDLNFGHMQIEPVCTCGEGNAVNLAHCEGCARHES